ncbi:PhzF family phenazine biosynthesis protein [soil metagenome]
MSGKLPFVQVDAFVTDAPFTGNPAGVVLLDDWLPAAVMQGIAMENNLADTAFLVPLPVGAGADYGLRWFTPTVEVELCGHATFASGHVLMGNRDAITFRTVQAGDLVVAREDGGEGLAMRLPDWGALPKPLPEVAALLGGPVVESLWRDGGYAVLVYPDADAVRALQPDFAAMRASGNLMIVCTAPGEETDVVSRVFVPGAGIDEDPATGSAHCVIARYWAERLGRPGFTAYQASRRGGALGCRWEEGSVTLTGRCRTVITGDFYL